MPKSGITQWVMGARSVEFDGFKVLAGQCSSVPPGFEPWMHQFLRQDGKCYSPIDPPFLDDEINAYGLKEYIRDFHLAREMICDCHSESWAYLEDEEVRAIHEEAKMLYGLLHARWICTARGLEIMKRKIFKKQRYGRCPRFNCNGAPLIPVGMTPVPRQEGAKLFCPRCADIYEPNDQRTVDGAHFGPSFPAVFLVAFPECDLRKTFVVSHLTMFGLPLKNDPAQEGPHRTNNYTEEELKD